MPADEVQIYQMTYKFFPLLPPTEHISRWLEYVSREKNTLNLCLYVYT